jgi:hypothetical protein
MISESRVLHRENARLGGNVRLPEIEVPVHLVGLSLVGMSALQYSAPRYPLQFVPFFRARQKVSATRDRFRQGYCRMPLCRRRNTFPKSPILRAGCGQ